MELRQIRYFLALADELHFTRAAARLHISQPPLSQQIKALEEELGTTLFVRGPRSVSLTAAGETFRVHARRLVEEAHRATAETRRTADGSGGAVRIGMISGALYRPLPDVLPALERALPDVRVELVELNTDLQIAAILADEIGLGLMSAPSFAPGLSYELVSSEPLCAVFSASHRAARLTRPTLAALADDDFILVARDAAPIFHDRLFAECVRAGFTPRVRHGPRHTATMVEMVRLGLGVALVPRSIACAQQGLAMFELHDAASEVEVYVGWKAHAASGLVRHVVEAILATRTTPSSRVVADGLPRSAVAAGLNGP